MSYHFLLDLSLILLSTKVLGLVTKRFKMPQVVGALLAGLVLGPAMLNVLTETEFITQMAELGVIILMFTAGLETDIKELKKTGKASFVIALIGVIVPLLGGFALTYFFNHPTDGTPDNMVILQNIFVGVILTATSVSISVETLKEMGKLNTRAGNAILGAAIIDDVLGIIALTVITSLADSSVNVWIVLLKIVGFFVFVGLGGYLIHILFEKWVRGYERGLQRFVIIAFVICLIFSYSAEKFFGVADITGAFFAGLIITKTTHTNYIARRFGILSYIFLSPVFFANIGLQVVLPQMSGMIVLFAVLLSIVAVLTKIVGCGLGAKMCKFSNQDSIRVGMGMISRGEVALIVASKGNSMGLIAPNILGPVIIVVVVTTIVSPILLKLTFQDKQKAPEYIENDLAKQLGILGDEGEKDRNRFVRTRKKDKTKR